MIPMYPEELIKATRELAQKCGEMRRYFQEEADKKGDSAPDALVKRLELTDAYVNLRAEVAFILLENLMQGFNFMSSAIDKLPDREEFNGVKAEILRGFQEMQKKIDPVEKLMVEAKRASQKDIYQ